MLTDSENNTLLKTNILVSQKIMYHIRDFFFYSNKREKTKKNKLRGGGTRRRKTKKTAIQTYMSKRKDEIFKAKRLEFQGYLYNKFIARENLFGRTSKDFF